MSKPEPWEVVQDVAANVVHKSILEYYKDNTPHNTVCGLKNLPKAKVWYGFHGVTCRRCQDIWNATGERHDASKNYEGGEVWWNVG